MRIFFYILFLKNQILIAKIYLTLTVGDNNDNLELDRFGGKGGVFPQWHSPLNVVARDKIGKGLVCRS